MQLDPITTTAAHIQPAEIARYRRIADGLGSESDQKLLRRLADQMIAEMVVLSLQRGSSDEPSDTLVIL